MNPPETQSVIKLAPMTVASAALQKWGEFARLNTFEKH